MAPEGRRAGGVASPAVGGASAAGGAQFGGVSEGHLRGGASAAGAWPARADARSRKRCQCGSRRRAAGCWTCCSSLTRSASAGGGGVRRERDRSGARGARAREEPPRPGPRRQVRERGWRTGDADGPGRAGRGPCGRAGRAAWPLSHGLGTWDRQAAPRWDPLASTCPDGRLPRADAAGSSARAPGPSATGAPGPIGGIHTPTSTPQRPRRTWGRT